MEKQLHQRLAQLLDTEKFDEARKVIDDTMKTSTFDSDQAALLYEAELFGFLIDIGSESLNENDLLRAIQFFETNEQQLKNYCPQSTYYYNLANAKHGLGKIFYGNNRGVQSPYVIKEKFQEPINLYWLAYKSNGEQDGSLLGPTLINLSNSLITVGRMVEGLQFLDIILRQDPTYPQALISRADNLHHLSLVTNCAVTVALYVQIYKSYDDGINTNALPPSILNRCIGHRDEALNIIRNLGFDINDIAKEVEETKREFNNHTRFRKFCINNFLTLNEHSLYCNCAATKDDDLQIGVQHGLFKGDIIPKLELLLNRIKSEYAFARWSFFQSLLPESEIDFGAKYSELLDGEVITPETEMQRTSFRICYGILDKIALGICKLYNLDSKRIHFETFWDEPKRKLQIEQIKNPHLNALYSIACDLNTTTGELKHFKNWRNKMEHNLLVLKDTNDIDVDILKIFQDVEFVTVADVNDFQSKTLHLLQLTRAAIFSFVYCVRLQTIEHPSADSKGKGFIVKFK